jgi:O-antigen/teichoic acid export membrane protein
LAGYKFFQGVIQLAVLMGFYLQGGKITLLQAVAFFSFSSVLSAIILEISMREIRLSWQFSVEKTRALIKYAIPVFLGAIGWVIMVGTNTIMIKYFRDTEQVGFYSVGVTLVQIFSLFPEAVSTLIMPKIAAIKDKTRVIKPLKLAVISCFGLSILFLIPLLYLKKYIITMVFTEKYLPTLAVILPLSIGQIFLAIHQVFASVWQGLDRPGIPSLTISIVAVLNLAGSYFLTKTYGIMGSAISIAICSIIAFIIISLPMIAWAKRIRSVQPVIDESEI